MKNLPSQRQELKASRRISRHPAIIYHHALVTGNTGATSACPRMRHSAHSFPISLSWSRRDAFASANCIPAVFTPPKWVKSLQKISKAAPLSAKHKTAMTRCFSTVSLKSLVSQSFQGQVCFFCSHCFKVSPTVNYDLLNSGVRFQPHFDDTLIHFWVRFPIFLFSCTPLWLTFYSTVRYCEINFHYQFNYFLQDCTLNSHSFWLTKSQCLLNINRIYFTQLYVKIYSNVLCPRFPQLSRVKFNQIIFSV